ncbi:hypothetical protein BT69DRAFT_1306260 [Atractiella rhizophila]|nr:hypothetical protein BT69DRAFT_1306260 [Atractiella rhizophila]
MPWIQQILDEEQARYNNTKKRFQKHKALPQDHQCFYLYPASFKERYHGARAQFSSEDLVVTWSTVWDVFIKLQAVLMATISPQELATWIPLEKNVQIFDLIDEAARTQELRQQNNALCEEGIIIHSQANTVTALQRDFYKKMTNPTGDSSLINENELFDLRRLFGSLRTEDSAYEDWESGHDGSDDESTDFWE